MINIAVVEDIDELRDEMAAIIQAEKELLCVYTFCNAEDALETLAKDPVDIVLMDIHLPGMNGIECVRKLKQKHPSMLFMMCTIFQDDENIFNALKAGASGYVLKSADASVIVRAIKELHAGGAPMNVHIARRIVETFRELPQPTVTEHALLTKREYELLGLLARGLRYKEIADQLTISIETVRKHINNIYTKLQVQSRMEAVNKVFGSQF